MKRIISLTLALVMVLGTFGTVFAADASVVSVSSNFLKEKGVLQGNEKGDLMLGSNLLRRDAVILLSRLMGVETEAQNFATSSTSPSWGDVDELPSIYNSYLAWAETKGYFVGKDTYRFGPNETLTVPEYAIVLLRALEYDTAGADAWKAALENAEKIGLLEDLDVEFGTVITRSQMSVMTFNALGTAINGKDETLAKRLNIVLPVVEKPEAETLEIKGVKTENLKEVIVELTKSNIDEKDVEKLENAKNYRLAGFSVTKATKVEDQVILELNKALVKGKSYDLVVRNVLRDVNGTFKFTGADNEIPAVVSVEVLGEYGIKVTTSEPIKDASERDFQVDGKNVTMSIETYGRTIILTPYHNEKFSEKIEKVTINSLEDFAGFKSSKADFEVEFARDEEAPKVVNVAHRGNTVEVEFDKDVAKSSIKAYEGRRELGNISFQAGRVDEYATGATKIDTNKVRYTFERELPRRATVIVEGVANHSNVVMEREVLEIEESLDFTEPEIIDEKVDVNVEERTVTITLEFDREVDGRFATEIEDGFDIDNHVSLFERETTRKGEVLDKIESVKYGKNKSFVVIELVDLSVNNDRGDFDYIAEVRNFTDVSSLRNRMYTDYIEFELVREDAKFSLEDVTVKENRYSTDIEMTFNNPVNLSAVERADNYLIFDKKAGKLKDIYELDGKIHLENKGRTVVIELPDFKADDYGYMIVSRLITDLDKDRLEKDYTYNFALDSLDNGVYKATKVDGKRVITPNAGVTKVFLTSSLKGEFVINGNLEELVINTPYADVTIAEGVVVETVKVNAIAKDSLQVLGEVKNLVVSTNLGFSVYGNVTEIQITTTENKAAVRVSLTKAGEYKLVEVIKGEVKDLGTELGIVKTVEATITVAGVEVIVVKDSKDVVLEAVEGKYSLVVGAKYTVLADGYKNGEITVTKEAKAYAIELELLANNVVLTVTNEGVEFAVLNAEGVAVEAVEGKYNLAVGSVYTIRAEGFEAKEITIVDGKAIEVTLVEIVGLTPLVPATPVKVARVLSATKAGVVVDFKVFNGEEEVVAVDGVYNLAVGTEYTVTEVVAEGEAVTSLFTVGVEEEVYVVVQADGVELVVAFVVEVVEGE